MVGDLFVVVVVDDVDVDVDIAVAAVVPFIVQRPNFRGGKGEVKIID